MTQDVYGGRFARTESSLLLQSSYADFDFMLWEEFQLFGYVKPVPAELRVKEYELYRSVYCGLCVSMKKRVSAGGGSVPLPSITPPMQGRCTTAEAFAATASILTTTASYPRSIFPCHQTQTEFISDRPSMRSSEHCA